MLPVWNFTNKNTFSIALLLIHFFPCQSSGVRCLSASHFGESLALLEPRALVEAFLAQVNKKKFRICPSFCKTNEWKGSHLTEFPRHIQLLLTVCNCMTAPCFVCQRRDLVSQSLICQPTRNSLPVVSGRNYSPLCRVKCDSTERQLKGNSGHSTTPCWSSPDSVAES